MAPYYDHQVGRFEPPALPDHREIILARARRARAEATRDLFRTLYRGLELVARGAARLLCYAGHGAAWMPPRGDHRGTSPAHLTAGCK
jgi:hypothetical protein